MAYATSADVESRLGRTLTAEEAQRFPGLLEEASVLVEGHCGRVFDPVPTAVRVVVSKTIAQALTAPRSVEGVSSEQLVAGPFSRQYSFTGEGQSVWLGASAKRMLRPFTVAVVSVGLLSDRSVV